MTINDQHSAVQPPRTLSPTASSAPWSVAGPSLLDRPAPTVKRDDRGELDIAAITSDYVAWQRVQWGGADPGGRHFEAVRRSEGAIFTAGAGRHRVELHDVLGRHCPVWERQYHTLAKGIEVFERVGAFG